MKKLMLAMLALVLLATGCSRVPPGNQGVRVSSWGSDKGVSTEVLGPGRYWNGPGYDMYLFPTFSQNVTWTKSEGKGLSFQTVEGLVVGADVGITYYVDPTKVGTVFQTYRRGVDEITDTFLRNLVRDAMVKEASNLSVEAVYGSGKQRLIEAVEKSVREQVASKGIVIEKISWVSDLTLPDTVTKSINAKIQATQMAAQRQNEVAQAKAEAEKAVATAKGEADSVLIRAQAEAEAIRIRGDALRNNQELVSLTLAEKWNGSYPATLIVGSDKGQILQIPMPKQ